MIKNKKGFTLIELIIVMAIIGILAVVAIVAISGKSADARDARRQADMSAVQTGLALNCYTAGDAGTTTNIDSCGTGTIAAGGEVVLSTCADLGSITLSGINDPNSAVVATACTDTASASCNYGVTIVTVNTSVFDSCDYDIYAWLETGGTTADLLHVTPAGMIKS
jgi:prepilin-type N-terminal cleavage/methylation domain-containing protein